MEFMGASAGGGDNMSKDMEVEWDTLGEAGRHGDAVGDMARARAWSSLCPMRGRALPELQCV